VTLSISEIINLRKANFCRTFRRFIHFLFTTTLSLSYFFLLDPLSLIILTPL
jgi:hypothetical protein